MPCTQLMSELPQTRVVGDSPAFTNVELDCFGPISIVHW